MEMLFRRRSLPSMEMPPLTLVEDGGELRAGELAAPVRVEDLGAAVAFQSFDEGLCARSGHQGCWIIQNRTGIRWATPLLYLIRLRFAYGIGFTWRRLLKKPT